MDITRFPLCWPAGRPRAALRGRARFKTTFGRARDELLDELRQLKATNVILSTNCELSKFNGLPRADRRPPSDPGVAVYFEHKGRETCIACDKWCNVEDNLQAINHAINAIRGIARWGTGDMVDAAFSGFSQLPAHAPPAPWYVTLEVPPDCHPDLVEIAYRKLTMKHHPDRGGDTAKMAEINVAYEKWKKAQR